jgi:hypothetical protein
MDVNGAKALKRRLGADGADEAPPVAEPVDIPADAPPVFHWTGKTPAANDSIEADESSAPPRRGSLFSRLSLSAR